MGHGFDSRPNAAVGQLRPNGLGLFDIHGNASEWTMPDAVRSKDANSHVGQVVTKDLVFEHRGGHVMSSRLPECFFISRPQLHPDDADYPPACASCER